MEYLMNTPILPRILLLEDNPISREFLHEALKPLGFAIDIAETLAKALLLARQYQHGLFLCDVHLPDGGPGEIFSSLGLIQKNAITIAITADVSPEAKEALIATGYQEVWGKPISMATLQNNITRLSLVKHAHASPETPVEFWDEAAALKAVAGNRATLNVLREMFLSELPQHRKIITQAFDSNDAAGLKSECHKLLAACGFVGAAGLSHAVRQLSGSPNDSQKLIGFIQALESCRKQD
jgi:CheY-like chemotaxis protein